MKRYIGGPDGRVFVLTPNESTGQTDVVELGWFTWGKPISAKHAELARALCRDLLGPQDQAEADRVYRRFMHRTVTIWTENLAWTKTAADLLGVIASIQQVEKDTAKLRAEMSREKPQFQVDALGPGQVWDSNPNIVPNKG